MKGLVKDLKLPTIHFHNIWHTYASILISEGVDIVKISNRLGTNPKITLEFYAHLSTDIENYIADIFCNDIRSNTNNLGEILRSKE